MIGSKSGLPLRYWPGDLEKNMETSTNTNELSSSDDPPQRWLFCLMTFNGTCQCQPACEIDARMAFLYCV